MKKLLAVAVIAVALTFLNALPTFAQNAVAPTFFGMTTFACYGNTTGCSNSTPSVYWPFTSSPAINIGAEGKGLGVAWSDLETGPGTWNSGGGYFNGTYSGTFANGLDALVNAAYTNSPQVDFIYTFYHVPYFLQCYDFGTPGSPSLWYGGNGNRSCTGASLYFGPNAGNGDNTNCTLSGATVLYCPGPPYNINDLLNFASLVVNREYDSVNHVYEIANYEIWNEPDQPGSWQGTWDQLVAQTISLESAITGIDSSAQFIGPAISSGPAASIAAYITDFLTASSGGTYGYQLISAGTFHFYPTGTSTNDPCSSALSYGIEVECTGYYGMQVPLNTILSAFYSAGTYNYNINDVWMTEGSWYANGFLPGPPNLLQSMRAYVARYELLVAAQLTSVGGGYHRTVSRNYWWAYPGDPVATGDEGTLCSWGGPGQSAPPCVNQSGTTYGGGYAYGQVFDWLTSFTANGTIGGCSSSGSNNGDSAGSIWTCSVTEPNSTSALAVWAWDNGGPYNYTVPAGYVDYLTLEGGTVATSGGSIISVGEEPILLEQ